jgi:K+-sensing histidine kinase KdpD
MWTGVGLVAPMATALLLVPGREWLGNTNAALVLVTVVIAVAASGRRLAAVVAALSAGLAFDFFHTYPFNSLQIDRREDIVSAVLLTVAGLLVAEVATWGRRQRSHAERTVSDVAALRSVAELTSSGEDEQFVLMSAAYWLRQVLTLRDCRYEITTSEPVGPVVREDGVVALGELRWNTERQGLPGPEVFLPVRHAGRLVGRFVLAPEPGLPVAADRLYTAAAIADQIGSAVGGTTDSAPADT